MSISSKTLNRVAAFSHELDREEQLPEIERIAGLYPRGYMSIFAAQAGTGKTWFMEYIACALSRGGNILSGLVPKSKPMKTVIFAGETGKYLLAKRLQATNWEYNKSRIKIYDAIELQREEIPILLNTTEGRATLITIMEQERPDVIFFDTLISFHSADESKQGEMTSIIVFLLKIAEAFHCAVVLNHHLRKRSSKNFKTTVTPTQDDVIGSNVAVRMAASVFIAYAADEEEANEAATFDGMPLVTIKEVKSWDKKIPIFSYQMIYDDAGKIDFLIEWGKNTVSQERSLRERVKALVDSHEAGAILSANDVSQDLSTSKDSARKYMEELADKGRVERQKFMNSTVWRVL